MRKYLYILILGGIFISACAQENIRHSKNLKNRLDCNSREGRAKKAQYDSIQYR